MLDKDTKRSPWRLLCLILLLLLLALLLGFCSADRVKHSVCNGVCEPTSDKRVVVLMNKARRNGVFVETPYSKLFYKDDAGNLMTPRDAHWYSNKGEEGAGNRATNSSEYVPMKTSGLNPACYSLVDYKPPLLDNIALTSDDISIRVLDFGEDGSLETYNLNTDPFNTGDPTTTISSTKNGNYKDIQKYIMRLTRANLKHDGTGVTPRTMPIETPADRTPLHKGFDKNQNHRTNGYVYFYVLADKRIEFVRDAPALYAHVPDHIQTLYSPYFEYAVVPDEHDEYSADPDILTLHFKRSADMVTDVEPDSDGNINCRYPYDIAVIADGQDTPDGQGGFIKVNTPLLVDPNTGTKGSAP